jgi:DNA ligase-1
MTRFGRRLKVDELRKDLPLSPFFFDCLYLDGDVLIDTANTERVAALVDRVPEPLRIPRRVVTSKEEAELFLQQALASGHEGVVAKEPASVYDAGRRGSAWLKLKPTHTLDLVVLAAEWGNGRRQGFLSNLHLGARDPERGGFAMLGKTFKGLTDEMLAEQTQKLLSLATEREGHIVHVKPEWVVEIAFDGVQQSPHYASGFALRFARVKRFRPDKTATEADSIDRIRSIFAQSRDHGQ